MCILFSICQVNRSGVLFSMWRDKQVCVGVTVTLDTGVKRVSTA